MKLPTALPQLSGRWLAGYRIVWFAMLALALTGVTVGLWTGYRRDEGANRAAYGAGLRFAEVEGRIRVMPVGSEAVRAGIQPNSSLVAVNGQRVPDDFNLESRTRVWKALDGPDGRALRLTIRAPDGKIADHHIVRSRHHLADADAGAPMTYQNRMRLYLAMNVIGSLPLLIAAVMLFRRRAADPVVALLSFGLLGPIAGSALVLIPDLQLAERASVIVNAATGISIFLAITVFPSGRFEPRWSLIALPLIPISMTSRLWAPDAVRMAGAVVLTMLVIAIVVRRYVLLPPGIQRQQVKWAALGFTLFLVVALTSIPLRLLERTTSDNWIYFVVLIASSALFTVAVLALVGGLLVSLLRYRLYDADAAISRSAVYAALTVCLLAIFAGTEKFIEIMGEQYFGATIGSASGAIAAGLAAVMIAPLHNRMSDWAERRFQRNLIRLRRDLPLLIADLRETTSPEILAQVVLEKIASGVRSSRSALAVNTADGLAVLASHNTAADEVRPWLADWSPPSRHDALNCERGDDLFPIRIPLHADGASTVGWVLLGPRPDGSFYGKDEREVLLEIADSVARGIAVARRHAEREMTHRQATELVNGRLSALETLVAKLTGSGAATAAT